MVEVILVGGFLGSGKTTWLSNILVRSRQRWNAVVVNEMASVGVDDLLLSGADHMELVTDGCICCDRIEALRRCLLKIVDIVHRLPDPGCARIFVETTGLADPGPILEMFSRDAVLATNLWLGELVVTVDGVSGTGHLMHQSLARAQVARADRIVVSKADLVDEKIIVRAGAAARRLNPMALLFHASNRAESPLNLPEGGSGAMDPGNEVDDLGCSTGIAVHVTDISNNVSWPEYALWIEALVRCHPHAVLRSKGVINTPNGPLVLQTAGGTVARPIFPAEFAYEGDSTKMIFILDGLSPERLTASLRNYVPSAAV